jgi:hypothetical protein
LGAEMINTIIFFPNGNTAVFDENGEQMPELQKSWFRLFINSLGECDLDNTEIIMPDRLRVEIIKLENNEFNWGAKRE